MRMNLIAASVSLLVASISSSAVAEEMSADSLQSIAAIGDQGVDFSTTHQEFLRRFPTAQKAASSEEEEVGLVTYGLRDVVGKSDTVVFQFLDDQLLALILTYEEARVDRYGGVPALLDRAKSRFGRPTTEIGSITAWDFPTIDRRVGVSWDGSTWRLMIYRTSVQERLDLKRAQLDAGF